MELVATPAQLEKVSFHFFDKVLRHPYRPNPRHAMVTEATNRIMALTLLERWGVLFPALKQFFIERWRNTPQQRQQTHKNCVKTIVSHLADLDRPSRKLVPFLRWVLAEEPDPAIRQDVLHVLAKLCPEDTHFLGLLHAQLHQFSPSRMQNAMDVLRLDPSSEFRRDFLRHLARRLPHRADLVAALDPQPPDPDALAWGASAIHFGDLLDIIYAEFEYWRRYDVDISGDVFKAPYSHRIQRSNSIREGLLARFSESGSGRPSRSAKYRCQYVLRIMKSATHWREPDLQLLATYVLGSAREEGRVGLSGITSLLGSPRSLVRRAADWAQRVIEPDIPDSVHDAYRFLEYHRDELHRIAVYFRTKDWFREHIEQKIRSRFYCIGETGISQHRIVDLADQFIQYFSERIVAGHSKFQCQHRTLLAYVKVAFRHWWRDTFSRDRHRPRPTEKLAILIPPSTDSPDRTRTLELLLRAFEVLTPLELEIMTRRWMDVEPGRRQVGYQRLAQSMGISRYRVEQNEKSALSKLHDFLQHDDLAFIPDP